MNKFAKKIFPLVLCALLLASASSAFAAGLYKDVPDGHWAAHHIKDASESGMFYGYPDGSFKPEKNVSKQEALAVIYRVIAKKGMLVSSEDFTSSHKEALDRCGFLNSVGMRKPASYFLEQGIASEADFAAPGGAGAAAPRELIAYWAIRAMGFPISPLAVIPFGDADDIALSYMHQIDAVYRNKIMVGGTDGNFMPKRGVRRAEVAAVSMRLLKFGSDISQAGTREDSFASYVKGRIIGADVSGRTLIIDSESGRKKLCFAKDAEIVLDGASISFDVLSEIRNADLVFSSLAGVSGSVLVQSGPSVQKGKILSFSEYTGGIVYFVELESGASAAYIMNAGTGGDSPEEGQRISFIADGVYFIEVR